MNPQESSGIIEILYTNYGIRATSLTRLSAGVMNENYHVETAAGAFVLRRYVNKTEEETRLERYMLTTLSADGFPCPSPLTTTTNTDVIVFDQGSAIMYPMLLGEHPIVGTPDLLRQIGALQGTIHLTFQNTPSPWKKNTWEPEDVCHLLDIWRPRIEAAGFPDVRSFLDFIERELQNISLPTDLPTGLTHQDIKPENALVKNGRITGILDFDNGYEGAFLHDLTTTIMWWCFVDGTLSAELVDAFCEGYESVRPMTTVERALLLTDGLRFRFLREMVIGPITTLSNLHIAATRALHFQTLYRNTFK